MKVVSKRCTNITAHLISSKRGSDKKIINKY